jgi:hypothetical protein
LPTVSAASAALTQKLQQFNYPKTLNAVLIGELLSAFQKIGAGVKQTATVTDKTNNNDQLKLPAAFIGNIRLKAIGNV